MAISVDAIKELREMKVELLKIKVSVATTGTLIRYQ